MKKNLLTIEGHKKLQLELRRLIELERPYIIKEIQSAREQGDLSENADYEAAKEKQVQIESRIQELQQILTHYEIIQDDDLSNNVVKIGSTVELKFLNTKQKANYEIVGSIDTDPEHNKISNECPLAKAMLGHKIGDVVEVIGINKPYSVEILSIVVKNN